MDRLTNILRAKKMKGVNWEEIAENLPISSAGLRAAFSRGSVNEAYLDRIEQFLQIGEQKEKGPIKTTPKPSMIDKAVEIKIKEILSSELQDIYSKLNELRQDLNIVFEEQIQKSSDDFSETSDGIKDISS